MARAVIIASYLDYPIDIPGLLHEDDYIVCLDGGYDIALSQDIRPDLILGDFDSVHSKLPEDSGIKILRYPPEKDYSDLELAFQILDPEKYPRLLIIGGLGGRLDQTVANIQMLLKYTAGAGYEDNTDAGRKDNAGAGCEDNTDAGCGKDSGTAHRFERIEYADGRNRCFAVAGSSDQDEQIREYSEAGSQDAPDDAPGIPPAFHKIPKEDGTYLSLLALTDECSGVTIRGVKYPLENAVLKRGISLGVSNEFTDNAAELSLDSGILLVTLAKA